MDVGMDFRKKKWLSIEAQTAFHGGVYKTEYSHYYVLTSHHSNIVGCWAGNKNLLYSKYIYLRIQSPAY